jgi:ELWxxDGT repeat protein
VTNGTDPLVAQLRLFLAADDGVVGRELFLSDGTPDGTSLFMDINTNTNSNPANLVVMNGVTYFVATDGSTGLELWKSNGTAAGTVQVKGINTDSASSSPSDLMVVGSTLYFRASDGANGSEL